MASLVKEYVPVEKFGVVRNHNSLEEFAGFLVRMRALSPESAVSVSQIEAETGIDRRGIYNRLAKPGFVKVTHTGQIWGRYFYVGGAFVDLAKMQGVEYYPLHLGPLVSGPRVPAVMEFSYSGIDSKPEIVGELRTDVEDGLPLLVRAGGISDQHILNSLTFPTRLDAILHKPWENRQDIDNLLVLLAGVRRWLERFDDYDVERQTYIKEQADAAL